MPNPNCAKCGQELKDFTDLVVVDALHAYHRFCAAKLNNKIQKPADAQEHR